MNLISLKFNLLLGKSNKNVNYAYINGLVALSKKDLDETSLELEQYIAITRKNEQLARQRGSEKATDKYLEAFVPWPYCG